MSRPFPFRVEVDRAASRAETLRRLELAGFATDLVYGGSGSVYLDDPDVIRRRPRRVEMALPAYVPGMTVERFERRLLRRGMRFADLWESLSLAMRHPEIFDPQAPDASAIVIFGAPFRFYHGQVCVPGFGGLSDKPMFEQYRIDESWGEVRVFATKP